jgi:hypothetical protein
VVARNLSCRDLFGQDVNGLADPYCLMYSRDLFAPGRGSSPDAPAARTKVKYATLTPAWSESLSAMLMPELLDVEDLRSRHLTLSVWDFGACRPPLASNPAPRPPDTLSHDDPMGEVVFCMDDLVDAFTAKSTGVLADGVFRKQDALETWQLKPGECAFMAPVIFNGMHAGRMSGVLAIKPNSEWSSGSVRRLFGDAMCCWKLQAHAENCLGR